MDALGCRRPDVLTRVSEYVPEIMGYIDTIHRNDLAYLKNGSVYFSVEKFQDAGMTYGKFGRCPGGDTPPGSDGHPLNATGDKRCSRDFALWKRAKPGEPAWDSPWGRGRPGWHIECSAMASAILGPHIDIHSGGEDLCFPHHENEIAQAEAHAYSDNGSQDDAIVSRPWVKYFLHSGHLHIDGLKMSKSLKNFITIQEALQTMSARQLRLLFLMHLWNKGMHYNVYNMY
jgi:cysteinyl-tRNA synthetase